MPNSANYWIGRGDIFAKIAIRTKICCTTYKKIWSYQKKAVSLQRERRNQQISRKPNTKKRTRYQDS